MARPVLITPPAAQPVSLAELKLHLRIFSNDDDALLLQFINAATSRMDGLSGILGRCLVSQVWRQDYPRWAPEMRLPLPDVMSVVIKYDDENEVEQTVSSSLYEIIEDEVSASIVFKDGFSAPVLADDKRYPIRVEMTAGYGDAGSVPGSVKTAIMMLAGHFYDARGDAEGTPYGVDALVAPYRRVAV